MFETYVQVTFVHLKFVLVLNLNFLGNKNCMLMLFFTMKIGSENLFGLKYLVWQKIFFLTKSFRDPKFVGTLFFPFFSLLYTFLIGGALGSNNFFD